MAEERLIDDDKDKKYRFRKNENGEEELIIEGGDETEEEDVAALEVPEFDEDDEEAAVLTPEQLLERRLKAERERVEREKKFADSMAAAQADSAVGNFATALDALTVAEEIEPENGEVHALKLLVYTRNCTEWEENAQKAAECAEAVKEFTAPVRRAEIAALAKAGGLEGKIAELKTRVQSLSDENEAKRADRAVRFNADNKRALTFFIAALLPFVVFAILGIYFSSVMYAKEDGTNIILTIVFACLALVMFIVFLFAARAYNTTSRRVRLNKKDTSTELGRKYLAEKAKLDGLTAIYTILNEQNDLS